MLTGTAALITKLNTYDNKAMKPDKHYYYHPCCGFTWKLQNVSIVQTFAQPPVLSQAQGKEEVAGLPFDEEHELSLSVRGADDAFRLEIRAEVGGGVRVVVVRLQALHGVSLRSRLHIGLKRMAK